jgi:hypothetical protein
MNPYRHFIGEIVAVFGPPQAASKVSVILLLVTSVIFGATAAHSEPLCVSDSSLTLEQMAAGQRNAHTIPKDLVVDRRELDFRSKKRPTEPLYAKRLPLETAENTGMYFPEDGSALCRVREKNGSWWLVVGERSGEERSGLGYLRQENLETKPAVAPAAERKRRPVQTPADSVNSIEGTWTSCGPWRSSKCTITYTLLQRGNRVCGYYESIGAADRIYAGQLTGRRKGNRIDVEYICGRPETDHASHWCPNQGDGDGDGWDSIAKSLFVCEGKLYTELGECAQELVMLGLERHPLEARAKQERTTATWLSKCLADDKFPPPELMAPPGSPIKH